ncbi:MAG: hypothetical protein K2G37_06635 [Clostridia bacterium]|nr:hypothetical protein [Clostridia bacterium]MDE7329433.1 hypothetical protein [Clostridia bacterium]
MKKTVLILYSEHYDTSALALKDYLEADGRYDVVAVSEREYDNFRYLRSYRDFYRFTYRKFPAINNVIVNLPTAAVKRKKDSDGNIVNFKPNSETYQRFRKFDNIAMRFDAHYVICTTQYSLRKAVIAREKYNLQGKIFALLTDYVLQDNFVSLDIDGYFVVTKKAKHALINKGVEDNKIFVIHMPLPPATPVKRSKEEIKKQFDIRNDLPTLMVVGGRYGSKYLYDALVNVCEKEEFNILVFVDGNIGVNKKFKRYAKNNFVSNNVYIVQKINDLSRAYYIADYILAAPTSAICYEALLRKIPLILMDGANNVENKNSKYLVASGYAYSGINKKRIDRALEEIDKSREQWAKFCETRVKDDGCEQFLTCLNLIDEGKDPIEEYLNRTVIMEDEGSKVVVDVEDAETSANEENTIKKKKKGFFKRRK